MAQDGAHVSAAFPARLKHVSAFEVRRLCHCAPDGDDICSFIQHLVLGHAQDAMFQLTAADLYQANQDVISLAQLVEVLHDLAGIEERLLWLLFLKLTFSYPSALDGQDVKGLVQILFRQVEGLDIVVEPELIEVVLCMIQNADLTQIDTTDLKTLARSVNETIWTVISTGLKTASQPLRFFKIWLRWFHAPKPFMPQYQELYIQEELLRKFLESQSQQIQKFCLYILRRFSADPRSTFSAEPFCRTFETVIIGGYANQVDDCLRSMSPELLLIKQQSEAFALDGSWWSALIIAGLSLYQTDSIRRKISHWFLSHQFESLESQQDLSKVIEAVFDWASDSSLFLKSVIRKDSLVKSVHGEKLSHFVSTLLCNCETDSDREHYLCIFFKATVAAPVNIYLCIYLLHGVNLYAQQNSLDSVSPECLSSMDAALARLTLTGAQKRVPKFFIDNLRQSTPEVSRSQGLAALDIYSVTQSAVPAQDISELDITYFLTLNYQRLNKAEYERTVQLLLFHLPQFATSDHDDLYTVIQNLYEGMINRYVGLAARRLPEIILHPTVRALAWNSRSLSHVNKLTFIYERAQTRVDAIVLFMKHLNHVQIQTGDEIIQEVIMYILKRFVSSPPTATNDQLLEFAIAQLCKVDDKPVFAQASYNEGMGHAYFWDILNQHNNRYFVHDMLAMLLSNVSEDHRGVSSGLSLTTLQAIIILLYKASLNVDIRRQLSRLLIDEKRPRNRHLYEWAIITTYWNTPKQFAQQLRDTMLYLPNLQDETRNPRDIVSELKILVALARHPDAPTDFVDAVMVQLPALCASTKVAVRFEALFTVSNLMEIAKQRNVIGVSEQAVYINLDRYVQHLLSSKGHPLSRKLELFNPLTDQTLANLFEGNYLFLEDGCPGPVTTQHFRQVAQEQQPTTPSETILPALPIGETPLRVFMSEEKKPSATTPNLDTTSNPAHQSKSFKLPTKDLDLLPNTRHSETSIILVASLIDSPYNLGGLCRAAEIYGCTELHIPRQSITKDKAFTTVSVSSELHIPLIQTVPANLHDVLITKKQEGFSVVGIEQTDNSKVLGHKDTSLPKRVVLVMGAEKTGIPPDVLVDCDECLEIQQWGKTRSLNVQTAAATVLYEWRRQWGDG